MDLLTVLIRYAEGKISHNDFENELLIHPEIWNEIQKLMPKNINDENCAFRRLYGNIQGLETNNFSAKGFLLAFSYNSARTYGLISALIKYSFPSIECHEPPDESTNSTLEKIDLDYIGGIETDNVVQTIIFNNSSRLSLKKQLKHIFSCKNHKHPNWVQEPEWPMGVSSPMRFISQSHEGDLFKYVFEDVDTGELRTIIQLA